MPQVVKFIRQEKWYGVSYDDGDYEELEHQELLKLLEWNSSQHDSIAETVQSQEANAASAGPAKAEGMSAFTSLSPQQLSSALLNFKVACTERREQ